MGFILLVGGIGTDLRFAAATSTAAAASLRLAV